MNNKFCKFIIEKWPSALKLKNSAFKTRSNVWSQYLECLIYEYAKQNNMYFLREVLCDDKRKLDYLISAGGNYEDYFNDEGKREKNLDWHAVIEAQWDSGKKENTKKDFKNITGWTPSSDSKGRIAIFNIGGGKNWEAAHEKFIKDLKKKYGGQRKKRYLILLTTPFSENEEDKFGFSAYYDWKRIQCRVVPS